MRRLAELREVERAAVFKGRVHAATLHRRDDAVVLSYEAEYLDRGGRPLATSLPLSWEPVVTHAPGALPPFLSGMLPEGRRLSALRHAIKTSADDEFTLLLAVGADAVGDVRVLPEGDDPGEQIEPLVTVERWSDTRFRELFAASVGGGEGLDRVALPGVQDKVSARMINLPVARRGARYLLKLNPPEFPHLVENEAFFLDAARRSGLEVAEAEVVRDAEGEVGLLVKRFDRVELPSGDARPLAQEDGCQVLGRYPADKYRVSTEVVVGALASICQARPVAALTLVRQVAFAYLSCNGDAHAKNFSAYQLEGGEWRITPAYDLPSSWPSGDVTMALSINGRRKEDIGRADLLALGASVGLRPRGIERALDELCESVELWIGDVTALPFDPGVTAKLARAISYRQARLRG